ncbi:MAG: LysR family transcriptional regulator [Burkholderiaceae bacterium]
MDSLNLLRTFREVAHHHSFAAAGRVLDLSPASVSKYVAELEARFHVRLFHRSTRCVSLTDAGQLLYLRSGSVVELFDLTEGEMLGRATHPSGRLYLTAPHVLMHTVLVRKLGQFMLRYPDVALHLTLTNRMVDMAEDGIDLAFRVGPISDSSLIVRRLLALEMVVAATPAYWHEYGHPKHPRELLNHRTLAMAPPGEPAHWQFSIDGKAIDLPLKPLFTATDAAPLVPLARDGLGVIRGSRMLLREWIDLQELEPLFGEYSPRNLWLYAAYAQRRHKCAAMDALLSFLEVEMPRYQSKGSQPGESFLK